MFLILALPRSRTAWLSNYLSYPLARPLQLVGHNILGECPDIETFLNSYSNGMWGTVEPAGAPIWRVVRQELPECKIVLVRRPLVEVHRSALNIGIPISLKDLAELDQTLELASSDPSIVSIPYDLLSKPFIGRWLFEELLQLEFDFDWWIRLVSTNVQVPPGAILERWDHQMGNYLSIMEEIRNWPMEALRHLN